MLNVQIAKFIEEGAANKMERLFSDAEPVLQLVIKALDEAIIANRNKAMTGDFDKPAWSERQAYLMGYLKALDYCKQLLTR